MNKAILVVICDFLVSSMLSMMTGMVPARTGGTGVGMDANTTKMLLQELSEKSALLERARAQLREAAIRRGKLSEAEEARLRQLTMELVRVQRSKSNLEKQSAPDTEKYGKLSPQELQKQLEAEAIKRLYAEMRNKDQKEDLERSRKDADVLRQAVENSNRTVNALVQEKQQASAQLSRASNTIAELSKNNQQLVRDLNQAELAKTQSDMALQAAEIKQQQAGRELRNSKEQLAKKDADLRGVREELRELSSRMSKVNEASNEMRTRFAVQGTRLVSTERDLAAVRSQLDRMSKEAQTLRLERNLARAEQHKLASLVQTGVQDVTKAKLESDRQKALAVKAAASEQAAVKAKKQAEEKLKIQMLDRSSECYNTAVLSVCGQVTDKMFMERTYVSNFFVPMIEIQGKTYFPASFRQLTGNDSGSVTFHRIIRSSLRADVPGKASEELILASKVFLRNPDYEVALVQCGFKGKPARQALKVLTLQQLQKRGLAGLYLFQSRNRCSYLLNERCSLDLSKGIPRLIIRNATRGERGSNARFGDCVVSKQGEFIGMVSQDTSETGSVVVWCFTEEAWKHDFKTLELFRNFQGHCPDLESAGRRYAEIHR